MVMAEAQKATRRPMGYSPQATVQNYAIVSDAEWESAQAGRWDAKRSPNMPLVEQLQQGAVLRVEYPDHGALKRGSVSLARLSQERGFKREARAESELVSLYRRMTGLVAG